ncbi:TetR/AcrR family transcriptional regulator [Actinomadura fibrosa]|uniref:TetR/AcrR family transcriptional regulator n=1 Tax=Actinomadura fibrosa TaxID=111802 RepID=A0ABW2XZV1_9ACTN|nr:TetR/AcrR family transcriptional regulator [Actinomadura fibrosa]
MPSEPRTSARPLRADARRNRERVLQAAVRAFAEGSEATLEAIAKDAGVGIGTLYRHFPTREALVEAAYRNELGRLCDAAAELLDELPPDQALRAWMDRFVAYMSTKRDMAEALRQVIASGGDPFAESRDRMAAALNDLLSAGAAAGTLRPDADPSDVLVALAGITQTVTAPDPQAGRILDLLMDGLRPR